MEDWPCFAGCFIFPAIGCLTTEYIQGVVLADQCSVLFTNLLERFTNSFF